MANSLSSSIIESLKLGQMAASLPRTLLARNRSQVQVHDEGELWDYKERLDIEGDPNGICRLAKRVLGFHNAKGGVLICGIDKQHRVVGVPKSGVLDKADLRNKLSKYIGANFPLFLDQIPLPNGRVIWLIFIPKRQGEPVAIAANPN